MLDILELESRLVDTIVTFTSFLESQIVIAPVNANQPDQPYITVETMEMNPNRQRIDHALDDAGNRLVTQHYTWDVKISAYGENDANGNLITSATAMAQEMFLAFSTELMQDELECYGISLQRADNIRRSPQLVNNVWEDRAMFTLTFGLADGITEFVSYIETLENLTGTAKRGPEDPNPINIT